MTGAITMREMQDGDRDAVMQIFNHYAATGFAAYPDRPLPPAFFPILREDALSAVVMEDGGSMAGFGLLKPFLPFPSFRRTGMLTYFLAPDAVGKGLGSRLLQRLTADAQAKGIAMLVANMSSKNDTSIRFHERHGFVRAGHLEGVGEKFGENFGVIWMQKTLR